RFDVIRQGQPMEITAATAQALRRGSLRRGSTPGEGRWSLLTWGSATAEAQAIFCAGLLLQRHGLVARGLVQMGDRRPPWRGLYDGVGGRVWGGEVGRGFLREGRSGAHAARRGPPGLRKKPPPATTNAPVVLVHSLDPANLFGSGAPFDIPLPDGGTRPFLR